MWKENTAQSIFRINKWKSRDFISAAHFRKKENPRRKSETVLENNQNSKTMIMRMWTSVLENLLFLLSAIVRYFNSTCICITLYCYSRLLLLLRNIVSSSISFRAIRIFIFKQIKSENYKNYPLLFFSILVHTSDFECTTSKKFFKINSG